MLLGRLRRLEAGNTAAERVAQHRAREDALLEQLREMKFPSLTDERRAELARRRAEGGAPYEAAIETLRNVVPAALLAAGAPPPAGAAGQSPPREDWGDAL